MPKKLLRKNPEKARPPPPLEKHGLHPRNRHRGRYDFAALALAFPALSDFLLTNPFDSNEQTIDFANPLAVRALNGALLKQFYGVTSWHLPPEYLCPPIPGRVDYLHHAADLLTAGETGEVRRGPGIRVLDIGVGANCIYPLLGQHEYGWRFVGTDIDRIALDAAQKMIDANTGLPQAIELRLQRSPQNIFDGVIKTDDYFELVICNPPFHASLREAAAGSIRKWKNLGKTRNTAAIPKLNFGGQASELWCEGGEAGFVSRMAAESAKHKTQVLWFSALVSKEDHLPAIYAALREAGTQEVRTIEMAQGQKKSRIVAWTFSTKT